MIAKQAVAHHTYIASWTIGCLGNGEIVACNSRAA